MTEQQLIEAGYIQVLYIPSNGKSKIGYEGKHWWHPITHHSVDIPFDVVMIVTVLYFVVQRMNFAVHGHI